MHLQQLKGTQSSELGLWKWYHLSIEGIRKGDFFCRKWYIRGWTFGKRVSSPKNVTIKISRLLSCRGPKKCTRRCWGTQRIFFWKWAVNYRKRKFRRFEGIFKRFSVLLERIYLFLTPSGLDGYSPSQQSGLFHVYQPAEKKIHQYSNKRCHNSSPA